MFLEFDFNIRPPRQAAFSADGKPIGMFPKNQAKTMCVDVGQVYSPPVHKTKIGSTDSFGDDSQADEDDDEEDESSISSSASESSSIAGRHRMQSSEEAKEIDEEHQTASKDETESKPVMPAIDLLRSGTNMDSKSSSATITPVNKNFPRSPLDLASSTDTVLATECATTPMARSAKSLKGMASTINRSTESSSSPRTANTAKKQSSFSFITQLSDELSSRTIPTLAAANKKLTSMLRDDNKDGDLQKSDCMFIQ